MVEILVLFMSTVFVAYVGVIMVVICGRDRDSTSGICVNSQQVLQVNGTPDCSMNGSGRVQLSNLFFNRLSALCRSNIRFVQQNDVCTSDLSGY